uniref:5'-nucleotidase n=1 Tax=Glossina morsitans morsitans TaxID=37546 RepID=D3TP59_GLOMM
MDTHLKMQFQKQTNEFFVRLEKVKPLCGANCKIKDVDRVEQILNALIKGGTQRLQLVSDFDYTITKQRTADGTPVLSSFGIFNSCKSLPKGYVEETEKLYQKYRPIEVDPHLPIQEKIKYMVEWWTKSGELLVGFPFDENEIDDVAVKYKDSLRDQSNVLFHTLYRLNIPVLIFSAGLGNSVISVLKHAKVLLPNVKVISNFLRYRNCLLDGFQEPMIHTFNKNETVLEGSDYYDLVHERDHIIVMGDSIGDADMARGVPASSNLIKIGFLFDHVEQNLERYMDVFDIVLIDDQTMNVPLALLSAIEAQEKKNLETSFQFNS